MKSNIVYKMNNANELLMIPDSMEDEIIKQAHEQGHCATKKTEEIISREYFIRNCSRKVKHCIKNCVQCILARG